MRWSIQPIFRAAASGALILIETALLLEIALTILDPILFRGLFEYDPDLGAKVRAYEDGSNEFGFNDRDRPHGKVPGTYRILILGDSFNWQGGRDCSYPALLEQKFHAERDRLGKVEVLNAGYPGTGTPQEFAALKKFGMAYAPDMVVLAFFAGNDFLDAAPFRKEIIVNTVRLPIDTRHEMRFLGYPIPPASRTFALVRDLLRRRQSTAPRSRMGDSPDCRFRDGHLSEEAYFWILGKGLAFMAHRSHQDFAGHIQNEAETIHAMKEYLSSRGIDFKVAVLPDEVQVNSDVLGKYLSMAHLQESDIDLLRPQEVLEGLLQKEGIPFLDLTESFRREERKRSHYVPRNTHWNKDGNELATQLIFDWLEPALLSRKLEGALR